MTNKLTPASDNRRSPEVTDTKYLKPSSDRIEQLIDRQTNIQILKGMAIELSRQLREKEDQISLLYRSGRPCHLIVTHKSKVISLSDYNSEKGGEL